MGYLEEIQSRTTQRGGYLEELQNRRVYRAQRDSYLNPAQTGGPPERQAEGFLSGNLLSDVADVLSAPSYALAGVLQGKGAIRGIKERANWVDWLRQRYPDRPWATLVGGTAMNVVLDPMWVVTPAKVAGAAAKTLNATGAAAKLTQALEASPVVSAVERFTVKAFDAGIKPSTRRALGVLENAHDAAVVQAANLMEPAFAVAREIARQPLEVQNFISRYMEAGDPAARASVLNLAKRQGMDHALIQRLGDAGMQADQAIGQALVDAGVMKRETFEAWRGKHLRRVYVRFEDVMEYIKQLDEIDPEEAARLRSAIANAGFAAGRVKAPAIEPRIPLGAVKARKDLPEAVRQKLGELTAASYRLGRGAQIGAMAASRANMLRTIAANLASAEWRPGYLKMPDTTEWGALAGKWVPEAVHLKLNEWVQTPGTFARMSQKFWGLWKFGKVVLNPATHARNMLSNLLLADNAGLSPARIDIYAEALRDLATRGKWIQEAKHAGSAFVDTFAHRELPDFLDALQRAPGNLWEKATYALKKVGKTFGDIYNFEEQWGKLAVYIFKRKQGLSAEEAAREAERWLFNYRKVPAWVDALRSGRYGLVTVPFLTFSYKAIPAYVRALWTTPARVARWGKYAQAVEEAAAPDEVRKAEAQVQPGWMREGFWLRLPIEDDYGRPLYLDLNYILPFADIFNASGLFGRGESPAFASMPLNDLYQDLLRNQSRFTGRPIYPEGAPPEQKRRAVIRYVTDFLFPPLLFSYNYRKVVDALKGTPDWRGRQTRLDITLAHVLAGLKTRPVDVVEEKNMRLLEIRQQLLQARKNLIDIAQDPRLPPRDKEAYWEAGLEGMMRLIDEARQLAEVGPPAARPRLPHEVTR